MNIPQQYKDLVGTKQIISGGVFSHKKALPETEYDVLGIRRGTALYVNVKEMRETGESSYENPTYELLLKNNHMSRARWSRPFPIREINLKETTNETK